jgi:hypothetical protein
MSCGLQASVSMAAFFAFGRVMGGGLMALRFTPNFRECAVPELIGVNRRSSCCSNRAQRSHAPGPVAPGEQDAGQPEKSLRGGSVQGARLLHDLSDPA